MTPFHFSLENIPLIFGQDAAELEDLGRLKSFFIANDSYAQLRVAHPVALVVGQKGIGKTALLNMSAQADKEDKCPHVLLKGSEILRVSESDSRAAVAVEAFKEFVERSILDNLIAQVCEGTSEQLGMPPKAGSFISRLALFATTVATNESASIKRNAAASLPWIYAGVKSFNVYIDDTDIEWNGSEVAAKTISNLIQACFNIASTSKGKVRFKISIRSDLFMFLSTYADYIDKIQAGIILCRWSNDDILRVIAKRIAKYTGVEYDEENRLTQSQVFDTYFHPLFERQFLGQGAWDRAPLRQVMLSFVRQRPRDLIAFCVLCAHKAANNKSNIGTAELEAIIPGYCRNRFNDTVTEFKSELPRISELLSEMRPRQNAPRGTPRYLFTHDEMIARIKEIAQRQTLQFSYNRVKPLPADLIDFLFRINFLVATRESEGKKDRRYYDFADDIRPEVKIGRWGWEVHMAYRWAIKPSEESFWAQVETG